MFSVLIIYGISRVRRRVGFKRCRFRFLKTLRNGFNRHIFSQHLQQELLVSIVAIWSRQCHRKTATELRFDVWPTAWRNFVARIPDVSPTLSTAHMHVLRRRTQCEAEAAMTAYKTYYNVRLCWLVVIIMLYYNNNNNNTRRGEGDGGGGGDLATVTFTSVSRPMESYIQAVGVCNQIVCSNDPRFGYNSHLFAWKFTVLKLQIAVRRMSRGVVTGRNDISPSLSQKKKKILIWAAVFYSQFYDLTCTCGNWFLIFENRLENYKVTYILARCGFERSLLNSNSLILVVGYFSIFMKLHPKGINIMSQHTCYNN